MALAANLGTTKFVIDSLWDRPTHPKGWYVRSEHVPYAERSVPSLFISSNLHPDYHTPRDEPKNIDYAKLTRMAQWMYLTGWMVGNAARRPAVDPGFVLRERHPVAITFRRPAAVATFFACCARRNSTCSASPRRVELFDDFADGRDRRRRFAAMPVKRWLSIAAVAMATLGTVAGCGDSGPDTPPAVLTTLNVSVATPTLLPGQSTAASANGLDQNGAVIAVGVVTWSSSANSIATVGTGGEVTAVATGSAQITATSISGRSGNAQVTVLPTPVAAVRIGPAVSSLVVGATQQLVATALDANGAALSGRTVTWTSSDATRATVSVAGLVTGVAIGATTVTATSEGRSGTTAITVIPVPVAAITLSPAQASVIVGGTQQFTATTRDAAGNVLQGRTVTWASLDPSRVSISASGIATGVAVGVVDITASSEGRSASVPVTVSGPRLPACDVVRPIVVGQTFNSTLTAADCRLPDGSFTQKYELQLTAPTAVQIDMTSSIVDAYLLLQDAVSGTILEENDDDGGQTNARIARLLPAGRYIIYANTFDADEVGAFQLSVTPATAGCFSATPLQVPSTVNGALSTASCRLPDGTFANRYELNVVTAATYQITLSSTVFDAYLAVFTVAGTLQGENDDGAGGTNARLTLALPPGRYIVLATSFGPGEVGAFALDVRVP